MNTFEEDSILERLEALEKKVEELKEKLDRVAKGLAETTTS